MTICKELGILVTVFSLSGLDILGDPLKATKSMDMLAIKKGFYHVGVLKDGSSVCLEDALVKFTNHVDDIQSVLKRNCSKLKVFDFTPHLSCSGEIVSKFTHTYNKRYYVDKRDGTLEMIDLDVDGYRLIGLVETEELLYRIPVKGSYTQCFNSVSEITMYLNKCREKCSQNIVRVVVSRGSECMFPTQIHMKPPFASVMLNKEQYAPTQTDQISEVLYVEYCEKLCTPLRLLHGELKPLYGMQSLSVKGKESRVFFLRCLILLRNATQGGINKKVVNKECIRMSLDINNQYPANCELVLDFKNVCIFGDSTKQFPGDRYYVLYYVSKASSVCYDYPTPCMMSSTHIQSLQTCGFEVVFENRGLAISGVSRKDSGTCRRWREVTTFCNDIRGRPGRHQLKTSLNILIGFWGKLCEQ